MNIYFLVEGPTEKLHLQAWLPVLLPGHSEVALVGDVRQNNYLIISGEGVPQIYDYLEGSVADVEAHGRIPFLVMLLDTDELGITQMEQEVREEIIARNLKMRGFEFRLFVQYRTIETWLLGNRAAVPSHTNDPDMRGLLAHHHVGQEDPELMPIMQGFDLHAEFHEHYLRQLLRQKNMFFRKASAKSDTLQDHYLEALRRRVSETGHLGSLRDFLEFCGRMR